MSSASDATTRIVTYVYNGSGRHMSAFCTHQTSRWVRIVLRYHFHVTQDDGATQGKIHDVIYEWERAVHKDTAPASRGRDEERTPVRLARSVSCGGVDGACCKVRQMGAASFEEDS